MTLFGITGGIGMGKSTSGTLLEQRGFPVVDTDKIAHHLVEPGQPALQEIVEFFGSSVIGNDGRLRRDELAKKVFSDNSARARLESILHPRIRETWQTEVVKWKNANHKFGFVLIPLLFETFAASQFDATICVACSEKSQRERLRARGLTDEQIAGRIAAQWPTQKKMDASNYVVWTETTVDVHAAQLEKILGL